jgi:hypothetical protein
VRPAQCVPVVVQDFGHLQFRGDDALDTDESSSSSESSSDEENDEKPKPKRREVKFVASAYFSNMELTISDPSVFTPPSYCNTTAAATDDSMMFGSEEMPSVLERFITFD